MPFVLALFILVMLAFDRVLSRASGDDLPWYVSPFVWLCIPWTMSLFLLGLPIFEHREEIRVEHIAYIALCFFGYLVGCHTYKFISTKRNKPQQIEYVSNTNITYLVIAAMGFIGQFASVFDGIETSGVSILERFTARGLASARSSLFENQAAGISGKFSMLEPLTAFSFVLCTFFLVDLAHGAKRSKTGWAKWLAAISAALIVFNALVVSGGRMNLLLLVMMVFGILCLDNTRMVYKKFKRMATTTRLMIFGGGGTLLLAVGIFLASYYAEARMTGVSPDFLLAQSHRAQLNPTVAEWTNDSPTARFGLLTLSYFTVPVPTLVYFLDLPDSLFPGPYWGQYNFPGFSDNVMRRTGTDLYIGWIAARSEVFGALLSQGYGGNVWSTFLRDLAVDFTKWGVPVFLFVFGWITQMLTSKAYKQANPFIVGAASAVLVMTGYSVLHSLFYIQTVWGLLFYSLAAYFIQSFFRRFGYQKAPR